MSQTADLTAEQFEAILLRIITKDEFDTMIASVQITEKPLTGVIYWRMIKYRTSSTTGDIKILDFKQPEFIIGCNKPAESGYKICFACGRRHTRGD